MKKILIFLLILPSILLLAQSKKTEIISLSDQKSLSTICYMGESNPGFVILPPTTRRNNPDEAAVFEATYNANVPAAAKTAFNRATAILGNLISSPLPISVNVRFDSM